jgi:hypothetical protein
MQATARRIAGCAALAVALHAASPATARTVFDPAPQVYERTVTPGGLFYAYGQDEERVRVFVQPAAGPRRRLAQFDRLDRVRPGRDAHADAVDRLVELAASRSLVAAAVYTYAVYFEGASDFKAPGPSAVDAAPPDGPAQRLAKCAKGTLRGVTVDGRTVAYLGADCAEDGAIAVHDTATGERFVVHPPAGRAFAYFDLAGRYLAVLSVLRTDFPGEPDDPQLGVYDWRTGAQLYTLPPPDGFAIAADGTLVTEQDARRDAACMADGLAWHSLADPAPHPLAGRACQDDLLVAGDRVLWSRRVSDRRTDAEREDQARLVEFDYAVTDLAGEHAQRLFPPSTADRFVGYPVYFDGARVGYARPRCDGRETIVVDDVGFLERTGPPALDTCPILLREVPRRIQLRPHGDFTIQLRCPRGCQGRVRLFDPARGRHLRFPNFVDSKFLRLDEVPPGGRPRVRVKLEKADRGRLARAGRLELQLRVESFQPDGRSLNRSAPLTVLPPG